MSYPTHSISDAQSLMAFQTYKKETLTAFLLWWFLGIFGGHRFYMGKPSSGAAMLVITLVSIPLFFVIIGFFTYFALSVWWIVDAFLLSGWVTDHNTRLMRSIDSQVQASQALSLPSEPPRLPPSNS